MCDPSLSSVPSFAAAGPHMWNSLLIQLHNPDISYGLFRRQMKGAFLIWEARTQQSVNSDMWRLTKTVTYLLTYLFLKTMQCCSAQLTKHYLCDSSDYNNCHINTNLLSDTYLLTTHNSQQKTERLTLHGLKSMPTFFHGGLGNEHLPQVSQQCRPLI